VLRVPESSYPENLEDLNFDEWRQLHESNPRCFEQYRKKLLCELIQSAPKRCRPRLRGLMFQMESESKRCGSSLSYNLRLFSMMVESLDELTNHLNQLCSANIQNYNIEKSTRPKAKVLPFIRPGKTINDPDEKH